MEQISGGVCAAKGFAAAGVHCGIRKNKDKRDLALIYSQVPASAASVYTSNLVKGAPLTVTKAHLTDGVAQAIVCNSGNANTCNADGIQVAEEICCLTGKALGIDPQNVVVASTGVIGQKLDVTPIAAAMPQLAAALGDHSREAAEAIMTTDTKVKEIAVSFPVGGKTCKLGGIAKGSGMIHPDLATMLVFLTTDCAIAPEMLQKALKADVSKTFNMVSVDGDTSTNDMVTILANGMAGNDPITAEGADFESFMAALNSVTLYLCRAIAGDGEGATKLLECKVTGAKTEGRGQDGGQEHHLLLPHQGCHVRRRRQLGAGAVRHRLLRRRRRRLQGGRVLRLEEGRNPGLPGRRRGGLLRGKRPRRFCSSRKSTSWSRSMRERAAPRPGAATSPTTM